MEWTSANDVSREIERKTLEEEAMQAAMRLISLCQQGRFRIEEILPKAAKRMQVEAKQAAENLKRSKATEIVSALYPEYQGDEEFFEFVCDELEYEKDLVRLTPEGFAAKHPKEKFLDDYNRCLNNAARLLV